MVEQKLQQQATALAPGLPQAEEEAHLSVTGSACLLILCTLVVAGAGCVLRLGALFGESLFGLVEN